MKPKSFFQPEAIAFLQKLQRNNRREWFLPRKAIYETQVKSPMLALISAINDGLAEFAPEHATTPAKAIFRIYRDTRFSADKRPYKTHVAAYFRRHGLERTSGAGFYFHVSAKEVVIAGGVYMPTREQLWAIRSHLLDHHREFRKLLGASALKKWMEPLEGEKMSRLPKGLPRAHPAEDLLLHKQWAVSATLDAGVAARPGLLEAITVRFAAAAPLVKFLNTPLLVEVKRQQRLREFGAAGVMYAKRAR